MRRFRCHSTQCARTERKRESIFSWHGIDCENSLSFTIGIKLFTQDAQNDKLRYHSFLTCIDETKAAKEQERKFGGREPRYSQSLSTAREMREMI